MNIEQLGKDKQIQVWMWVIVAAAKMLTGLVPETDPILWNWVAKVEMTAREFAAVPVIPEKKGKRR